MVSSPGRLASSCAKVTVVLAVFFAVFAPSGRADSVLVGTDLSGSPQQGARLCPQASNCDVRAQEFTLLTSVDVSSISVLASGPFNNIGGSNFSTSIEMSIRSQFPLFGGSTYFDDTANFTVTGANYPASTQLLTFSGLNLMLGPGTYYLQAKGGDIAWGGGNTPLVGTAGTLGAFLACDPTATCGSGNVQTFPGSYGAFQLAGTTLGASGAQTPEPGTWLLSGTGLLAFGLLGWSKAARG